MWIGWAESKFRKTESETPTNWYMHFWANLDFNPFRKTNHAMFGSPAFLSVSFSKYWWLLKFEYLFVHFGFLILGTTGLPTLDESLEWEMRGAVRCQPIKSRKSPKKLMSGGGGGGGGGTPTLFFFYLKIFASILQAHSRGTLRTSQTSDKQKKKKKLFARERFLYHCESVRMWWNVWVSRSMRESWQPWNNCVKSLKCWD